MKLSPARKLVGLAQVRRAGTLVQCGIYAHFDADRLASLLAVPDRPSVVAALREAAVGLTRLLPAVTLEEVRNAWEASEPAPWRAVAARRLER
jgi:lipoate-protein ligase A